MHQAGIHQPAPSLRKVPATNWDHLVFLPHPHRSQLYESATIRQHLTSWMGTFLFFHPRSFLFQSISHPHSDVIVYIHQAVNVYYYKYTVDGMNVIAGLCRLPVCQLSEATRHVE